MTDSARPIDREATGACKQATRHLTRCKLLLQATLSAIKFRNCKPHYLWLPLKRRVGERELPGGELHLRVQWTSDELERPMEALPSWALDVQLKGVGLSIIEANVLKFPREVRPAHPPTHAVSCPAFSLWLCGLY